ncbi:MAG TPA: TetR/AcrR family transcriptional regulator [Burkholderiaceae bacterium]|nr:TetR/AcrR family transcriptional regulator [Burkholderiaceae bacterium]
MERSPRKASAGQARRNGSAAGPGARERLREAATRLFAVHGYSNVSIDQICAEAEVSKGAFYYHFDSKDAALYGIYQPLLELQMQRLREILARPAPLADKLRAVAEDVARICLERIDDLTVFMQSMHLLEPKTRALVGEQRREYHQLFAQMIEAAQAERIVRSDVPPDLLINQLFGPLHYSTIWYRRHGPWKPEVLARQMTDMWLGGVRVHAAAAEPGGKA